MVKLLVVLHGGYRKKGYVNSPVGSVNEKIDKRNNWLRLNISEYAFLDDRLSNNPSVGPCSRRYSWKY